MKARIERNLDDEDIVTDSMQSDISSLIDDRFDAFNLTPPEVTPSVDLSHVIDPKAKELTQRLIELHDKSFSKHRFDVRHFLGFTSQLDHEPNSLVIEQEKP